MARTRRRDRIEHGLFRLGLGVLGRLPLAGAEAVGEQLGLLAYAALARRRRVALANLETVFGEALSPAARVAIARASFRSLGRLVAGFAQIPRIDPAWVERHIVYQGLEHYRQARTLGRGVLYLAAHFGSWELIPAAQAALGEPMAFIVRPADNALIESDIQRARERHGNRPIAKQSALRECLRLLKEGGTVGVLVDQHVPAERGVATTFLGQRTASGGALAALALRTGAPVLPVFIHALGGGRHRIVIGEPIPPARSGDRERDQAETTQRYVAAVEREVRAEPGAWLWAHRRFRDGAAGAPELAAAGVERSSA